MTATTEEVWKAIDGNIFGVLAFVNANGEPRSAGICYVVDGRTLLVPTARDSWKTRHITANPHVSMTVTIPKRVPFVPFLKVPAATVTFQGLAEVLELGDANPETTKRMLQGLDYDEDDEKLHESVMLRIVPQGDFLTYGIAMPLLQMRTPERARGRTPCGTEDVVAVG